MCVHFIHDRALQLCPPPFQIGDPWGGSYLMEALTDQVYESALNMRYKGHLIVISTDHE